MNANIFKLFKKIPIGTILRKDIMGFTGSVRDFDGNLVGNGNVTLLIVREATKEEFLKQFEIEEKEIFESTLDDIDTCRFYEISTD